MRLGDAERPPMGRGIRTLSALGATFGTLLLLVPVAGAEAGGAAYASSQAGGAVYGAIEPQPVARMFSVSPRKVTAPALPTVRFTVDQPDATTVAARVVFSPIRGGATARVKLGRVRARKVITVRWPRGFRVAPGRYSLRLQVTGRGGRPLARGAGARSAVNLVVKAKPKPKPKPAPTPAPTPAPAPSPSPSPGATSGVFPVRGAHSYGDRFGVARTGYSHQGQDVAAAQGTPIVAPVAGSILYAQYQDRAGWYVVQHADDGRDFFFAHCVSGSVVVTPGQRVSPGTRLCDVGATGDATGPHLHFEIWVNGWRTSSASKPIDPLPQLQAWDR
jgi:murein DD-endopeptidase MepM/ murein hydrolase activator NlpD